MTNILFYGNCQTGSLISFIEYYLQKYNFLSILCWNGLIEREYFLSEILKADIIITQPISPNYRGVEHLSTEFILKNCKPDTKVIIFPSLHFDFYYVDLTYQFYNNEILRDPSDYHYNQLVKCYKNNLEQQYFIDNYINNSNYKSPDELNIIANTSLEELSKREIDIEKYNDIHPVVIIKASKFIKNNYKKQLLFYSMNHPTKYLMQYICKKILKELGENDKFINLDADPLHHNERGILYKCIQNVVEFNISEHTPHLSKFHENNIENIVKIYYDSYNQLDATKLN